MTSTLPWSWYGDADVLAREQELVFRRTWQYAGRVDLVREPGARLIARAGDVPVVVVRGRDGELRAFVNVCRHRGSVLVAEDGRSETIQCPYHAWTYELDGRLRAAPRAEAEGLDVGGLSLVPVAVDAWGPFVFVNAAGEEAAPLAETLGELPELLRAGGVDVDALVFELRAPFEVEANWKIAAENYLECYHCPVAHRDFSAEIDVRPESYVLEERATFASQHARSRGGSETGQFHFVWPNLKINVYPGRPNLSIGPIFPAGAGRTVGFLDYFFAADANAEWKRDLLEFDDQVGAEDRTLVESVQRGVTSGAIDEGRLLPESERLIAWFQRHVRAAVT